jgi:DNA-binding HxlR family transcriptional regulator
VSSSVLNDRLRELREASIVDAEPAAGGYRLTREGAELVRALEPLSTWAKRWGAR